MEAILDFEVTREKKYRLLFYSGSFKEQVQETSIQVWYSRTQLYVRSGSGCPPLQQSIRAIRPPDPLQFRAFRVQACLRGFRVSSRLSGLGLRVLGCRRV